MHHVALSIVQYLFECFRDITTGFCSYRHRPSMFTKHVYAGQQISHAVVEGRQTRHIRQVYLIQIGDAFRVGFVSGETNSRWFVQRVRIATV